jgi:hypothetical protein
MSTNNINQQLPPTAGYRAHHDYLMQNWYNLSVADRDSVIVRMQQILLNLLPPEHFSSESTG